MSRGGGGEKRRCQQCEAVFESQTGSGSEEEEGAAPHAPTQQ